ncbi:MAG: hypothetical protein AAGI03_01425 [Pseudomonadota bacterium]
MADKPTLYSGPMVRALLAGRKTQTRRILNKPTWAQEEGWPERVMNEQDLDGTLGWFDRHTGCLAKLPIRQPGDRLWVKETWADVNHMGAPAIAYQADGHLFDLMDDPTFRQANGAMNYADERLSFGKGNLAFAVWMDDLLKGVEGNWRPSIFMPRWVSRLTQDVTDVRIQRLQDISEEDAIAEGVEAHPSMARPGRHVYRDYAVDCDDPFEWFSQARDSFRTLWDSLNAQPKPRYVTMPDGKRIIDHYVSYPWDGEERIEAYRGRPHYVFPNPWVMAVTFTNRRGNIDGLAPAE